MTARAGGSPAKVGALALSFVSTLKAYIGGSYESRPSTPGRDAALADLRALMARHAAARDECGRLLTRYQDEYVRASNAEAERDRLRAALADLLHANGSGPKSCGHAFHCACPYEAARAALAECVASRPAGELGGGK